jgi:hypothetical protein
MPCHHRLISWSPSPLHPRPPIFLSSALPVCLTQDLLQQLLGHQNQVFGKFASRSSPHAVVYYTLAATPTIFYPAVLQDWVPIHEVVLLIKFWGGDLWKETGPHTVDGVIALPPTD